MAVGDDKVAALLKAGVPTNFSELQSFLGLAVYCSGHIMDLARKANPLWELSRQKEFEWLPIHTDSMEAVKKALVTEALAFFNIQWLTEVTVDASPVGLGAVLGQVNPVNKRDRKVVMYISRLLSEVERSFSQVEKESLAVVWSCERLYLYLCGHRFRFSVRRTAEQCRDAWRGEKRHHGTTRGSRRGEQVSNEPRRYGRERKETERYTDLDKRN